MAAETWNRLRAWTPGAGTTWRISERRVSSQTRATDCPSWSAGEQPATTYGGCDPQPLRPIPASRVPARSTATARRRPRMPPPSPGPAARPAVPPALTASAPIAGPSRGASAGSMPRTRHGRAAGDVLQSPRHPHEEPHAPWSSRHAGPGRGRRRRARDRRCRRRRRDEPPAHAVRVAPGAALRRGGDGRRPRTRLRRRVHVLRRRRGSRLRLRRRRAPGTLPRRGSQRRRPVPQRQPRGRRAALRASSGPGHGPGRRDGGLPARCRRRRPHRPGGPPLRRERRPPRPRRLPVRAGQRGLGHRWRGRLDRRVQRDMGRRRLAPDARLRQLRRPRCRRRIARRVRPARTPPPERVRRRLRATTDPGARLLHPLDPVLATGGARGSATCGWRTTATTTATARSSCGASSPAPRPVRTRRPRAGRRCRSGGWGSPART